MAASHRTLYFGSRKESVLDSAQLNQLTTFMIISYLLQPIKHVLTISSTLKGQFRGKETCLVTCEEIFNTGQALCLSSLLGAESGLRAY